MISWQACYKNGDIIKKGPNITYDNLNRHGLEAFQILFNKYPIVTIHLDEDRKLIYRLRHEQTAGAEEILCHLTGWRENGKDTLFYIFERKHGAHEVFPEIHLSGKFDRVRNRFFYPPKYRDFEQGVKSDASTV